MTSSHVPTARTHSCPSRLHTFQKFSSVCIAPSSDTRQGMTQVLPGSEREIKGFLSCPHVSSGTTRCLSDMQLIEPLGQMLRKQEKGPERTQRALGEAFHYADLAFLRSMHFIVFKSGWRQF